MCKLTRLLHALYHPHAVTAIETTDLTELNARHCPIEERAIVCGLLSALLFKDIMLS